MLVVVLPISHLYDAPSPSPLLAKPFQISHAFSPPVNALSASSMASLAWMKLGLQGCLSLVSFCSHLVGRCKGTHRAMASMTSFIARYFPS